MIDTMNIITKEQAKRRGRKTYFTGEPYQHGHICERYGADGCCVQCKREQSQKWQA